MMKRIWLVLCLLRLFLPLGATNVSFDMDDWDADQSPKTGVYTYSYWNNQTTYANATVASLQFTNIDEADSSRLTFDISPMKDGYYLEDEAGNKVPFIVEVFCRYHFSWLFFSGEGDAGVSSTARTSFTPGNSGMEDVDGTHGLIGNLVFSPQMVWVQEGSVNGLKPVVNQSEGVLTTTLDFLIVFPKDSDPSVLQGEYSGSFNIKVTKADGTVLDYPVTVHNYNDSQSRRTSFVFGVNPVQLAANYPLDDSSVTSSWNKVGDVFFEGTTTPQIKIRGSNPLVQLPCKLYLSSNADYQVPQTFAFVRDGKKIPYKVRMQNTQSQSYLSALRNYTDYLEDTSELTGTEAFTDDQNRRYIYVPVLRDGQTMKYFGDVEIMLDEQVRNDIDSGTYSSGKYTSTIYFTLVSNL